MEESASTFVAITGATEGVARGFLELTYGDVERAVQLFFENPELVSSVGAGAGAATSPPAAAPELSSRAPRPDLLGRQDTHGIIHIDSDDDTDMQFVDDSDGGDEAHAAATHAANLAQEEEDAALAKRLQEELYSENGGASSSVAGAFGGDGVRAPIGRTTEMLVAPDPAWGGEEDVGSVILDQIRRRRPPPARSGGPFSQRIWADASRPPPSSTENGSHARRLEDLFRPPYDLMTRATWDEARALGKEDKKWILVNLQDVNDFSCQALNRDIWKDRALRGLVAENFIFLQYDKDYPDAEEYITFYFPNRGHENLDNYPHVSIIDPRTGEQVKVWSGRPFPTAADFYLELTEFLDRYSLEAHSKNPVAKATTRKPQTIDVDRMTEEEMLEMALKNSMAGTEGRVESNANIHDPDALTKGARTDSEDEGKGKEPVALSAFAQVASMKRHVEPEHDPTRTTRIQFRHPNGRVIRRFNLQDPVRRLFEWLKAEPLEGKEGVEFELKKMPQGQDLIDSLDTTIEESGLKQGTVMIEFMED